ncbi:MAG: hypothetical protein IPK72_17175 [Candidatus Eisenbacteria bacterium]|nr:hypothetical protein [Candidatus Eisenbacteria bacterium]
MERGGGIYLENHASPTLRDLWLVGNTAGAERGPDPPVPLALGGGIYCGAYTQPQIQKVRIEGCRTSAQLSLGGGVYCSETSDARFVECTLRLNRPLVIGTDGYFSGKAGAFYLARGAHLTLDHSRIRGNVLLGYGEYGCPTGAGAALYSDEYAHIVISDSEISDNQSCGAVIHCARGTSLSLERVVYAGNRETITIEEWGSLNASHSSFHENATEGQAGVVALFGSTANVTASEFWGNTSEDLGGQGGFGGAIRAESGANLVVTECRFLGNRAKHGGAISLDEADLLLRSTTIAGNLADHGAGLQCTSGGSVEIEQSVFWGNQVRCGSGGPIDLEVESPVYVRAVCSAIPPDGIIGEVDFEGPQVTSDPLFCDLAPCDSLSSGPTSVAVHATSPCLPDNNACGVRIGAGLEGCTERGACCLAGGACEMVAPDRCELLNGIYRAGGGCYPSPCAGACCGVDGTCTVRPELDCATEGGTYLGDGTHCAIATCPSAGACCLPNDSCVEVTQESCLSAGGTYLADRVECPPYPCGPNRGGVLTFHSNPSLSYSTGAEYCGGSAVARCEEISTNATGEGTRILHVLAAFPSHINPALRGVSFGIDYQPTDLAVVDAQSCADLEQPGSDWPASGSGTSVLWVTPRSEPLVEVYWFAVENYGSPTELRLTPHPTEGALFEGPASGARDAIACLGAFGFDLPGAACCPTLVLGACCLLSGECAVMTPEACAEAHGGFQGVSRNCLPMPCVPAGVPDPEVAAATVHFIGSNPIDRATGRLEFEVHLGRTLPVGVSLFDSAGRLLRSLHDGDVAAGIRRFEYPANALKLPAGMLFLEVRVAGERVTRKLLLLD